MTKNCKNGKDNCNEDSSRGFGKALRGQRGYFFSLFAQKSEIFTGISSKAEAIALALALNSNT